MELAGHKCVGFCEFDKFAVASYTSMHLLTEEQREYLNTLPIKKRQKEILKDEYRNGEWYASDIREVHSEQLPEADCWCFGAPCQDFSVAGKRAGMDGDRSSLIREIFRLLEEQKEEDRPEWLIYENVKGMLSSNKGLDYLSILSEMDRLGYDIEWQNINSKWFVPQNRERIYTIGHLRRFGSQKILPVTGADGENSIQVIATTDSNRHSTGDIHSVSGIMSACTARDYKQPKQVCIKIIGEINSSQDGQVHDISGVSKCHSAGHNNSPKVAIPVITPDRTKKCQNGRRFKENGEPMFTLTAQDRHGVAICPLGVLRNVRTDYGKQIRKAYESGDLKISRHKFLAYEIKKDRCSNTLSSVEKDNYLALGIIDPQGRNNKKVSPKDICPTLRSETHGNVPNVCVNVNESPNYGDGIYVEMPEGFMVYAIWYEKEQCYITIRKLTPKECFRLQGWTDDYFEKAAFVNSDSQLYKQAGNGVTVSVVEAIANKM